MRVVSSDLINGSFVLYDADASEWFERPTESVEDREPSTQEFETVAIELGVEI